MNANQIEYQTRMEQIQAAQSTMAARLEAAMRCGDVKAIGALVVERESLGLASVGMIPLGLELEVETWAFRVNFLQTSGEDANVTHLAATELLNAEASLQISNLLVSRVAVGVIDTTEVAAQIEQLQEGVRLREQSWCLITQNLDRYSLSDLPKAPPLGAQTD